MATDIDIVQFGIFRAFVKNSGQQLNQTPVLSLKPIESQQASTPLVSLLPPEDRRFPVPGSPQRNRSGFSSLCATSSAARSGNCSPHSCLFNSALWNKLFKRHFFLPLLLQQMQIIKIFSIQAEAFIGIPTLCGFHRNHCIGRDILFAKIPSKENFLPPLHAPSSSVPRTSPSHI